MTSSIATLLERRNRLLGPGNPLFYDDPVHLVRGEGIWLFDWDGRRYLDCYNNVPCVGHCHPRVVEALRRQARTLNTHTRYLDERLLDYAERLLGTFNDALDRVALTCTGSEANDLALRIARVNTGREGFICTNATYHGNTTAVSQLNSIFEPVGGYGEHIRMVPWPDAYRTDADLSAEDLAAEYARHVEEAIDSLDKAGVGLAGILVCPIFANEGLSPISDHYLQRAVAMVRDAGGLFIADEVQSGFGRTGRWWGHESSGVIPDVVTLGKPMGAGHPIAGVVARGSLLDAFREQEMYFNTYGGNPVSCAVAHAVIDVLAEENLVDNAGTQGKYVFSKFSNLKDKFPIIGDVRGRGLFFGLDLVADRTSKAPATRSARMIVNALRHRGILISKIGEHDNVLKLRPPLCFSRDNADLLVDTLEEVLTEVGIHR